ncbi:TIGR00366 family protein [Negadavirga shengliensis]|uniref:TIGR00366 family protein n=1 Tax=Negadavirga shengliensis TaxID=1389218 RepID=A0ABV9SW81_9BACT
MMIRRLGESFSESFKRLMPDAFVFALLLTILVVLLALIYTPSGPLTVLEAWYTGFWDLLDFGMQMVLILVTGFAIALSPPIQKGVDHLSKWLSSPTKVYLGVMLFGALFTLVSWSWIVMTALLARQLAEKVEGIDYPYLVACVYLTFHGWVAGLSSSIPLLLNTPDNFLIKSGILSDTLSTGITLGSTLNLFFILFIFTLPPLLMVLLKPKDKTIPIDQLCILEEPEEKLSVETEALQLSGGKRTFSDYLNGNSWITGIVVLMGWVYIFQRFIREGFGLDLPIMIFIFLMTGMTLHKTPLRYVLAMKRASSNISGIVFQYPFYAGIMGIMLHTGLGDAIAVFLASHANLITYPFYAFLAGGIVNFAIPSAGGEFAVLAPGILKAVANLAHESGLDPEPLQARASMAIAYGESLTNLLQPFFFLTIVPVMCKGLYLQARDVLGHLIIPFILYFILEALMVTFFPL